MHADPFGRVLAEPKPDPEISNLRNLFRISQSVGMEGRNKRRDVAKVESLLGRLGELNLAETDGVTGFAGARLDEAVRRFQKRHRLKVDGQINPGGETIATAGAVLAASEKEPDSGNGEGDKPGSNDDPKNPGSGGDPSQNEDEPSTAEKIFGPASRWLDKFREPDQFPTTGPGVGGIRW